MTRLNLIGLIALALVWGCGSGADAALIGTETMLFDAADVSVLRGLDYDWDTEPAAALPTTDSTPAASSLSTFAELLAWNRNVDLFSASNAIVLAHRNLLDSDTSVRQNLPAVTANRLGRARMPVKTIPASLLVFGIAGWAVRRLCRTWQHSPAAPSFS